MLSWSNSSCRFCTCRCLDWTSPAFCRLPLVSPCYSYASRQRLCCYTFVFGIKHSTIRKCYFFRYVCFNHNNITSTPYHLSFFFLFLLLPPNNLLIAVIARVLNLTNHLLVCVYLPDTIFCF